MFCKRLIVFGCVLVMTACSDTPTAPPKENNALYQFPTSAQNPVVPFAQSPLIQTGPRVEFYSNGMLKQVFSTSATAGATLPQNAELALPANFNDLLDALGRKPLNSRTAHFVQVMRTLGNVPAAGRGKALEAISRQLYRETEHRDTTLADGTRVLEYYFDHQLAARVVLAAKSASGGRRFTEFESGVETPVARETVSDPDATTCNTCYDAAYDAMLWASVVWFMDQLDAMVGDAAADEETAGPYAQKMCLAQIYAWTTSVGTAGFAIAKVVEGWGGWTRLGKESGIFGIAVAFGGAATAWNAMHNCFHP